MDIFRSLVYIFRHVFSRETCMQHFSALVYYVAVMSFGRVKIVGLENVPRWPRNAIFVAKHIGDGDSWKIGFWLFFRCVIYWMAKQELFDPAEASKRYGSKRGFRSWISGHISVFVVNHCGAIKIAQSDKNKPMSAPDKRLVLKAILKATNILSAGGCVGIFPEGGQNRGLEEVKTGVELLQKRTGAMIIPVSISANKVKYHPPIQPTKENPLDIKTVMKMILEAT